jgi:hypothetical protein
VFGLASPGEIQRSHSWARGIKAGIHRQECLGWIGRMQGRRAARSCTQGARCGYVAGRVLGGRGSRLPGWSFQESRRSSTEGISTAGATNATSGAGTGSTGHEEKNRQREWGGGGEAAWAARGESHRRDGSRCGYEQPKPSIFAVEERDRRGATGGAANLDETWADGRWLARGDGCNCR